MTSSMESSQINVGDDVYGSDGDKVGTVSKVLPSHLVVEKGFFFPTDYYIPMSVVARASGGKVHLNVDKDAALNAGWDTVPETGTIRKDADVTVTVGEVSLGGRVAEGHVTAADLDEVGEGVIEVPLYADDSGLPGKETGLPRPFKKD
jgi:hypothetical protein